MQVSYSRVGCYGSCPYQYKLRYLDKLKTLPDQEPDNALYLGTAIHEAFETGNAEDAIKSYRSNYYMLTDAHINEEIKLEMLVPKVLALLPPAEWEVEISTDDFIGYIDRLVYLYTDDNGIAHYDGITSIVTQRALIDICSLVNYIYISIILRKHIQNALLTV